MLIKVLLALEGFDPRENSTIHSQFQRLYDVEKNVSECDDSIHYTAPLDQIDTGKICKCIERSEKFPMLELSNLQMQIFGLSLRGTQTCTAVTSMSTPPALSPAP